MMLSLLFATSTVSANTFIEPAPELWTSSISSQPLDFHYSKTQQELVVFGHNPARMVQLDPFNGSIIATTDLPVTGTLVPGVTVRESATRMDFAILGIQENGAEKLLCWDFYLQQVRWTFDIQGNLILPSVGKPEVTPDGTMIFVHFEGGQVIALNAFSGAVIWEKKYFPMSGWTYLDGNLYGGILAQVGDYSIFPGMYQLNANTGEYVDRWRGQHICFQSGTNRLADYYEDITEEEEIIERPTCNNIWAKAATDNGNLYIMDDKFGLMKFTANNIKAGPVWHNAFSTSSDSQQTYVRPVVSPDGTTIYASAYWTTAAIDAATGQTLWTRSQGTGNWLTHELLVSPYGEALYASYDNAVHKIWTRNGHVALTTDSSLLTTFATLDDQATILYTGGFNVGAFDTERITDAPSPSAVLPSAIPGGLQAAETESSAVRITAAATASALMSVLLVLQTLLL